MEIFNIVKKQGSARRGLLKTVHGEIETPCFMNVATCAAMKGAVSSLDLKQIKCQVALCNTYHLHLRPGDELVKKMGGLHQFMKWNAPILTDSGGYQVFSLAKVRKIEKQGVFFNSHFNGRKIFIGPKESVTIQSNLGSTIAMAFDECVAFPSTYSYVQSACDRTLSWLDVSMKTLQNLNSSSGVLNPHQLIFGISQGLTYLNLRKIYMKKIVEFNCDGYAIGGLAVGEPKQTMFETIEEIEPLMPQNKPRYLMGVGKPGDILESVYRGVDMFDCVLPARNARHGQVNSWSGIINLLNFKYKTDETPIDIKCECDVCKNYSKAYLRHLFKAKESLAGRLCTLHNLWFYNSLMERIRESISCSKFDDFREQFSIILNKRI